MEDLLIIDYAKDEDDLDRQWNAWNRMTYNNRKRSNASCLSKYSMSNLDRYEYFKSEFNKAPIDTVDIEDPEVTQDTQDTNDGAVQESETLLLYPEYNSNITEDEALKQGGFYDRHNVWNSIMRIPSDPVRLYRGRVECLIIRNNKVYLCKRPTNEYRLPGGSFEIKNDNETQCYNECKEEARILIKNIRNTGITYLKTYSHPADWAKDMPVQWTGQYIEVYVADFDKYYNGDIDTRDKDQDMYNNGRFYDIDEVYNILNVEHKKAIDKCIRNINIKEDSEDSTLAVGAKLVSTDPVVHNPLDNITPEMNDAAREWSMRSGITMILPQYNIDDLERNFAQFMTMKHYHRKISNQESIRIYGFTNIDNYNYQKHKLLKRDVTDVDIEDIANEDDNNNDTLMSESIIPINVKKKINIIKEELSYDYDKIKVYNMLDDLMHENNNFAGKSIVDNFIRSTTAMINTNESKILPYYTPREMEELGVFNENQEDNFYGVQSDNDNSSWFHMYKTTGNPGDEWISKISECFFNMTKNPTNENKQKVLECGWNPEIKFATDTMIEASKLTREKLGNKYKLDIVNITEALSDLDDYKEIPYIPSNLIKYNIADYITKSIELEHTTGRIFVDYNDIYVAHISIYNDSIVGIGSWYQGPDLLCQMINWAIKEKNISNCYCNAKDTKVIGVLKSLDFSAIDVGGRIVTFTRTDIELDESTIQTILETKLTSKKRSKLKENDFGVPELRKYPLNDESHVRSAIKFFNYVEPKYETELANNIIKKINKFNMEINIGEDNRFSRYYNSTSESTKNMDILKPVYIVTCYTASPFGMAIQKVTNALYTHASFGFDSSLEKLYSFNAAHSEGKRGGLSIESVKQYINDNEDADLRVSVIYLKEKDYNALKDKLDMYLSNAKDTTYNFKNLFNIIINKAEDTTEQMSMICSQFVDSMLKTINIDITGKPSNLVTPGDLSKVANPKVYFVYEGKARDYNPKKINRIMHKLIGHIDAIKESKFIKNAKLGIYYAQPIFEAKELPIGFDDSGALLIKNYKTIDYDVEYSRSNKLLKSYKANKNWTAMEYELCKLWFMNTVLLKKIEVAKTKEEKDKYIKIRAKIMNDFTIYLNEVNKNVAGFNFSEYYEQTPFGDAVIKISGSTLKYTAQYLKAALAAL